MESVRQRDGRIFYAVYNRTIGVLSVAQAASKYLLGDSSTDDVLITGAKTALADPNHYIKYVIAATMLHIALLSGTLIGNTIALRAMGRMEPL